MPFNQKLQKFNAKINTVTIGSGDKTVTIGGDSTYPFYSFDAPSENTPKIGVEISDMGLENIVSEGIKAYYDGASTIGEMAKKAAAMEGADFVALILEGGDPNGVNKSVDELIAVVKEVADAIDAPLVVEGCKNVEKDAELLPKVAEALQGRNVLILSEKEENYKAIGAAAGLAYDQIVGAESLQNLLCPIRIIALCCQILSAKRESIRESTHCRISISIQKHRHKAVLINTHGNCFAHCRVRCYRTFKVHPCIECTACSCTGKCKIIIFK